MFIVGIAVGTGTPAVHIVVRLGTVAEHKKVKPPMSLDVAPCC